MANHNVNLQDSFLNQVRKDGTEVEVTLVNGHTHKGVVRGFDNFTVILCVAGRQHLVYKHAIAQIIAMKPAHPQPQAAPQPQAEPAEIEPPKSARTRRKPPAPKEPKEKAPPKFNALDLSHIKIEEAKRESAEAAAKTPPEKPAREKAG